MCHQLDSGRGFSLWDYQVFQTGQMVVLEGLLLWNFDEGDYYCLGDAEVMVGEPSAMVAKAHLALQ